MKTETVDSESPRLSHFLNVLSTDWLVINSLFSHTSWNYLALGFRFFNWEIRRLQAVYYFSAV